MTVPPPSRHIRSRLALALDVPSLEEASALAARLGPWFGTVKVGQELFTAAGPRAVEVFREAGFDVFYDAKFYDIPTTVGRAARAAGRLGVRYVTAPAVGGREMLRALVEGLREGAAEAGHDEPISVAVTVLTSEADASVFEDRLRTAVEAGCGGVVCAVGEVAWVRAVAPGVVCVTPGIRLAGTARDDQARVGSPAEAAAAGADLVVVGRAVTAVADPEAAAAAVASEFASGLTAGPG